MNVNLFLVRLIIWNIYIIINRKNLGQYDRPTVFGFEPVDGLLVVLSSNQLNIATFVHQIGDVCISHLVAKFIWFELRTTSTPSTGLHSSMHPLGLSCWPKISVQY